MDPKAQEMVKAAVHSIRQVAEAGPFQANWQALKAYQIP